MKTKILQTSIIAFTGICLLVQFCFLCYGISKNADNWAIINSIDNDAGNAIYVTKKSYWFKDNGFFAYGNLYFRLANSLEDINPFTAFIQSEENPDIKEQGYHFALMLVSLISLFAISFLISVIITKDMSQQMISMFIINYLFLTNYDWTLLIFRAHPDILLSFLVAISVFSTTRFLLNSEKKLYFWLSAISWGLVIATKLIGILYLPGLILLLFIPKFSKARLYQLVKYYLIIIGVYFLAGFPQNFKVYQLISFLKDHSKFSLPATIDSFNEWWDLLWSQIWPALIAIIVLTLIWGISSRETMKFKTILAFFVICMLPFLYFLSRKIISGHNYYTLPVVAGLLIFFAFLMVAISKYFYMRLNYKFSVPYWIRTLSIIAVGFLLIKIIPNVIPTVANEQMINREEARRVYKLINEYQKTKAKINVDPGVPYNFQLGNVKYTWGNTFNEIEPGKTELLVIKPSFYMRYLTGDEPSQYVLNSNPNWQPIRKFYTTFYNKKIATDEYGQSWEKIHEGEWEIWKLREQFLKEKDE